MRLQNSSLQIRSVTVPECFIYRKAVIMDEHVSHEELSGLGEDSWN